MSDEEKLYAGKFKTIEDLEAGYKSSLPAIQENEALKKKVDELTAIPVTYLNPSDIEHDANRITDIQSRAKEAGLTQAQYEKFLRNDKARIEKNKANFEANRKEVGEETINILTDYVNKHYPKELGDNMLKTFIGNKEARNAALNHRQQLLNNQVPGMQRTSAGGGYSVTDADVRKAYDIKEKTRSEKDKQNYLNLVAAKAQQDKAS
jgi:hypothetical protein